MVANAPAGNESQCGDVNSSRYDRNSSGKRKIILKPFGEETQGLKPAGKGADGHNVTIGQARPLTKQVPTRRIQAACPTRVHIVSSELG